MFKVNLKDFPPEIVERTVLVESKRFILKFAETEEEIEKTLRLRYQIFNLEQGKGLSSSASDGIDIDEFDEHCLHLIVVDKKLNEPVGTYRINIGSVAKEKGFGLYSSQEYDIQNIDKIIDQTLEVGRSCVAPRYRNGVTVALLWAGLSELLQRGNIRYMIGCASLEKSDLEVAWPLYESFKKEDVVSDIVVGNPRDGYQIPEPSHERKEEILANIDVKDYIPPLLKGYLKVGAKIAGKPLYDYEFKTIDFLILLERSTTTDKYAKR